MRIELDDPASHAARIEKMIKYLEILDRATDDEDDDGAVLAAPEIPLGSLRQDAHVPFGTDLSRYLKLRRDGYVRAPKMV